MPFKPAVKHEAKLRLAIAGPSGSGKTYTSLAIATHLAQGKPIALVDTEHGSASKYADIFTFDVMEMEAPFHPDRFVKAIAEAAEAGYAVVILDSLTHAWQGTGGLLDEVDRIARQMRSPNTFAAWKDATPIQNRLVDAIVQAPIHIIATMRSKQEYILITDERGKQTPKKVGMAPQQREGFEYEFDVFGEMDIDNTLVITKTRCPALAGGVYKKPGKDVADILMVWLRGAKAPAPAPKPEEPKPEAPKPAPATPSGPAPEPAPTEDPSGWNALEGDLQRRANEIRQRVLAHAADAKWMFDKADAEKTKKVNAAFGIAWPDTETRRLIRLELLQRDAKETGYTLGEADAILKWINIRKEGDDWLPSATCLEDGKILLAAARANNADAPGQA